MKKLCGFDKPDFLITKSEQAANAETQNPQTATRAKLNFIPNNII